MVNQVTTQSVVAEIASILSSLNQLAEGAVNLSPSSVKSSVSALITELKQLVDQSGSIGSELKNAISTIITTFKDDKNPIDLFNDLIAMKGNFIEIANSIKEVIIDTKETIGNITATFKEAKGFVKDVEEDIETLFDAIANNTKEWANSVESVWHDAHNKTSANYGVGKFIKGVFKESKHAIVDNIEAVGQFVRDLASSNDTQSLIDFAHGIMNSTDSSAAPSIAPEPVNATITD